MDSQSPSARNILTTLRVCPLVPRRPADLAARRSRIVSRLRELISDCGPESSVHPRRPSMPPGPCDADVEPGSSRPPGARWSYVRQLIDDP
jgi:hypothetical protein